MLYVIEPSLWQIELECLYCLSSFSQIVCIACSHLSAQGNYEAIEDGRILVGILQSLLLQCLSAAHDPFGKAGSLPVICRESHAETRS
jgi:hypothetical protein